MWIEGDNAESMSSADRRAAGFEDPFLQSVQKGRSTDRKWLVAARQERHREAMFSGPGLLPQGDGDVLETDKAGVDQ